MRQVLKKHGKSLSLIRTENSVISMKENKMSFEDSDEAEYDILKKTKEVGRNYSLQQVVDLPRENVWLSK